MVDKPSFMVKSDLGRKVLPCQAPVCGIATNKRYRAPGCKPIPACCYRHAESAYLSQRKTLARAAA